jgi:PAS domain S-box-containing protein
MKDGSVKFVHEQCENFFDGNGSPLRSIGTIQDITGRKQAEIQLKESEENYQQVVSNISSIIWKADFSASGAFENMYISPVADELLQLPAGTIGNSWDKYFSYVKPEYLDTIFSIFKEGSKTPGKAVAFEYEVSKGNGETAWFHSKGKSLLKDGKIILSGYTLDITDKKTAEKELVRLATVIEQSSQTIVITDLEGRIEYVNPAFERITGYTFAEARGQNPRILKNGDPGADFYKKLWETIQSGETWQGIFHNRRKDGSGYDERAVIFPIRDVGGNITNYAAIKDDISKEKRLEEQLQQAQKMESIGTLAGGVAHDFNNLLTVINGYAEIALMKMKAGDPLHKDMSSILSAGKRAENLTRQLLAFSRKQIYKAEIVDVNQVISSMDKMLRRLIGEDINIETVFVDNLPVIKADNSQLEQIFVNLVVNARDALHEVQKPDFQKKITIETGQVYFDNDYISRHPGSREGHHIFFAVSDNGIGMDEQTKERVFEPFFTTKEKYKGTGLGLSTVYGIVKQNNGSIYVYSEPGAGTMFKINWPVTADKSKAEEVTAADELFYGHETLFIVEDEEEVCRFASDALTSLGYNVYKANNGRLALEQIKTESLKIDLIITDLIMPELNGKEFIEKVQNFNPEIKVIYVSGYTDNHIVHNGMLEEGVNFVQKPYSVKTLAAAVRRVLDEK